MCVMCSLFFGVVVIDDNSVLSQRQLRAALHKAFDKHRWGFDKDDFRTNGVELERGWVATEAVHDFEEGFLLGFVLFCHVWGFGGYWSAEGIRTPRPFGPPCTLGRGAEPRT